MDKAISAFLLAAAILLCLGGIIGFIFLFGRDLNVFWVILAPVILAVYQIPAVAVYYLWKRRKKKGQTLSQNQTDSKESESSQTTES